MTDHLDLPQTGFVSPAWVKRRYAISNSTMYAWVANAYLPAPLKVGPRAVRFRAEDLRAFEAQFAARDVQVI